MARPLWIIEGKPDHRGALIRRLKTAGLAENQLVVLHAVSGRDRSIAHSADQSTRVAHETGSRSADHRGSDRHSANHHTVNADELTDRIIGAVRGQAADSLIIECDTAAEAKAVERCTDDPRLRRFVTLQSVVFAAESPRANAATSRGKGVQSRKQVARDSADIANSDLIWINDMTAPGALDTGARKADARTDNARTNDIRATAARDTAESKSAARDTAELALATELYHRVNPKAEVFNDATFPQLVRAMRPPSHTWRWAVPAVALAVAYVLFADDLARAGLPVARFNAIFVGVFLQAVPFLAVGVLISAVIDLYVTPDWIGRHLPRNPLLAQLAALLLGFCLPVCDCSAIPIFHSLVRKRVPLPVALTFMLASPAINPIVIFSTWYAFNGNWRVVAVRCGLGALCALLVGASMAVRAPGLARVLKHPGEVGGAVGEGASKSTGGAVNGGLGDTTTDEMSDVMGGAISHHHHGDSEAVISGGTASCCAMPGDVFPSGVASDGVESDGAAPGTERRSARLAMRAMAVLRQSRYEFFDVGRYLVCGILISDVLQIALPAWHGSLGGWPLPLALLAMMALAFLLSLCSSADAVVARSMLTVTPLGPLLGFLVFGPMMDVKNVLMLAAGFRKGFVARLAITCAVTCFAVVAVFLFAFGKGVLGV